MLTKELRFLQIHFSQLNVEMNYSTWSQYRSDIQALAHPGAQYTEIKHRDFYRHSLVLHSLINRTANIVAVLLNSIWRNGKWQVLTGSGGKCNEKQNRKATECHDGSWNSYVTYCIYSFFISTKDYAYNDHHRRLKSIVVSKVRCNQFQMSMYS